jgi:hypothetical protein
MPLVYARGEPGYLGLEYAVVVMSDEEPPARSAFRITINGQPFCEADDLATVTMAVEDVRARNGQRISLYANEHEGPLHWMTACLGVGDRIVIEVVDATVEAGEPPRCDFCGREAVEVSAVVQGQAGSICDLCVSGFSAAVHKGDTLPTGASFRDDSISTCRFCGKAPPAIGGVVVRNGAALCAECLRTAADILGDGPQPR